MTRPVFLLSVLLALLVPLAAFGQTLPRTRQAEVPVLIVPNAAGGGEVFVELQVGADGRVESLRVLRSTPSYTELLTRSVARWTFEPARGAEGEPVPSRVLVAGVIRGPEFYAGTSPGTPPVDVEAPSAEIAFPVSVVLPVFPALAHGEGVVMLELEVDVEGQIDEIRPLTSGTGFEQAAVDAASQWTFRPARPREGSGDSRVVVVFGFRRPVNPS